LKSSVDDRRAEVDEAKRAFAGEFESLRSAIALTEERARASERRALAEIEAARHKAEDAGKALAKQQKSHASEIDRVGKSLAKREAEMELMRERLTRAESALSHCASQLKNEQLKFDRLLARVQPESHRPPKRTRSDTNARVARKGAKPSAQR
jgi:septal ring factor EnvC (AmiA/AmiB activator)